MRLRYLPNIITCLRLLLIIPFLIALSDDEFLWAFYLFITAGISDGIDGWLARQFNWQSKLGGFIDPLADKLLIACSFISLAYLGYLPWWLVALVFFRDIVITGGVIAWYRLFGHIDFEPTVLSKSNTVLQIMLVLFTLYGLAYQPIVKEVMLLLTALTTLTTTMSFIDYVWYWGRRAYWKKQSQTNNG